jgi:LPS sulfotransferase NodH
VTIEVFSSAEFNPGSPGRRPDVLPKPSPTGRTPRRDPDSGRLKRQGDPVRFVILAAPRTGSNMLCSMLNSHPLVICHHELFNPEGIHYALDRRAGEIDLGSPAERDRDPTGFLRRLWRHSGGAKALGFKLNRDQNEAAFHAVLSDPDVRKIILVRRNRIETFISELIAQETGRWESYATSDVRPYARTIHVDARQLLDHVARNHGYYATIRETLAATGQRHLEVAYEDLGRRAEQRRILNYLGVRAGNAALQPATRKVNARDLRDIIANHAALAAALAGSELEAELRQVRGLPAVPHGYRGNERHERSSDELR